MFRAFSFISMLISDLNLSPTDVFLNQKSDCKLFFEIN